MRSTFVVLLTLGLAACASSDPAVREAPVGATPSSEVAIFPEAVSEDRIRFTGQVMQASDTSFSLRLKGVTAGSEIDREVTVAIAPDGTFESEVFDLSGGADDGVYTATLRLTGSRLASPTRSSTIA